MSRHFGAIRQLGYVVHDIEAAMDYWSKTLGVGPWFYNPKVPIKNYVYKGERYEPHNSVALANSVVLQCTPGVALSMTVDGGLYNSGGRRMQLNSGTAKVAYQLFRDAALSQSLGISQSVSVAYANANNITLPIYGRVQLPGNTPGGTYSDTLQVQLTW